MRNLMTLFAFLSVGMIGRAYAENAVELAPEEEVVTLAAQDDDEEEEEKVIIEIPDDDTPTTDIPEEEIPTAEPPKTGDSMIVWILAATVSGLGLAWLALSGKKREDEESI